MTSPIITPDLVDLSLEADSRHDATRQLARLLAGQGRVTDLDGFLADVAAREAQMPTGIEGGGAQHMTILAALARRLVHASFREALATAPDAPTVVDIVTKEVLGS